MRTIGGGTNSRRSFFGFCAFGGEVPAVDAVIDRGRFHSVLASYNLHANCYVTKPLDLDEFIAAVRKIEDFWIALVKLPAA